MVKTVLFRLKNDGYISKEKFAGEKAYKTTPKGIEELKKMKSIVDETMEKIC
jgi:DNA-binding PadR family transcriptional regulator